MFMHVAATKELNYAVVKSKKQYLGNYERPQLPIEKEFRLCVRFGGLLGCL